MSLVVCDPTKLQQFTPRHATAKRSAVVAVSAIASSTGAEKTITEASAEHITPHYWPAERRLSAGAGTTTIHGIVKGYGAMGSAVLAYTKVRGKMSAM